MGKKSKRKGYRIEYELVKKLNERGINAKRIPLSGGSWLKGDILIDNFICEVKARANGFREIYKWLEDKDFLFIKADRKDYLVVMSLDKFINLMRGK
ncbi:MAG: hypothetical protein CBR30_01705 [Dictyoglomus sp. NZ13-RE01]|nr:MAG: hypothetical protein CBR30_01705 [Dictyoglomus sp. NZ13-RE01]